MVPHELLTLLFLHRLRITWQQPRLSRTSLIVTALIGLSFLLKSEREKFRPFLVT